MDYMRVRGYKMYVFISDPKPNKYRKAFKWDANIMTNINLQNYNFNQS